MIVLVQATVLTVGLDGSRNEVLEELPIRLITMRFGIEAARSLKNEKVDSVISNWCLDDMEDGQFIRNLKAVKPHIETIVFVQAGNKQQEIAARSLGVSAVLTDEAGDDLFRETVASILGLEHIISINEITPAARAAGKVRHGNR